MIVTIPKIKTRIAIIQNIPKVFFRNIEASIAFGNHLFPSWANTVFANTDLKSKFEAIYDIYKAIISQADRDLIVSAFVNTNQVEDLCNNNPLVLMIPLADLHQSIRDDIKTTFHYLYNTAINYRLFKNYVNDNVNDVIDRFSQDNQIVICPFCGIESFTNLRGQARIPFDHWLHKAMFPMAAVNFNNLVPIGKDCNARPAKGDKNVLVRGIHRTVAYYPYVQHSGITNSFHFINEPTINPILDADWSLTSSPNDIIDNNIFHSWVSTMNITTRYADYFRKVIFPMWENDYKTFVANADNGLRHAITNQELRQNFIRWRGAFNIKARPGSVLYISFINYLVNHASDIYIYGLRENFRR